MKLAVIGIGDIAKKAYLPVVMSMANLSCHLVTRDEDVLRAVGEQYRIPTSRRFTSIDDLLERTSVDAVCIHTATEAHGDIVRMCIERGIHVFVDKPLADDYERARQLTEYAYQQGCELMVGFNRRFAPLYAQLKSQVNPHILLMQKNRTQHPGVVRKVIFDDFIHVVDTLRFLAPSDVLTVKTQFLMSEALLSSVVVQLLGEEFSATGVMNRESGATEETLEVMAKGEKWKVTELREMVTYHHGEHRTRLNEWISVGEARGFVSMIGHFLGKVQRAKKTGEVEFASGDLRTHEICEEIVRQIIRSNREEISDV